MQVGMLRTKSVEIHPFNYAHRDKQQTPILSRQADMITTENMSVKVSKEAIENMSVKVSKEASKERRTGRPVRDGKSHSPWTQRYR